MYNVELKNVSVYYGNVCALKNINMNIKNAALLGVTGPNGGGKSTLLKVLAGIIDPSSGSININRKITIGYVAQSPPFNTSFPVNVMDVVLMGRLNKPFRLFHTYSKTDIKKARTVMKQLNIWDIKDRHISQLSGGQLQKALIGRALAAEPRLLLLDEPMANIDPDTKMELYHLMKNIKQKITIVMASHDIKGITSNADIIVHLNREVRHD